MREYKTVMLLIISEGIDKSAKVKEMIKMNRANGIKGVSFSYGMTELIRTVSVQVRDDKNMYDTMIKFEKMIDGIKGVTIVK